MNDQPRSHIERRTLLSVGIWYAGSSITNGAGSPENIAVFFSMIPETMIAAIPMKYADTEMIGEPPKIAPAIIAMNGTLAPHGMNVVVIIVIRLSRSFSIVRLAMIPGTPQPVPTSIGMNDLPERPNLRNTRSRTNAIRCHIAAGFKESKEDEQYQHLGNKSENCAHTCYDTVKDKALEPVSTADCASRASSSAQGYSLHSPCSQPYQEL